MKDMGIVDSTEDPLSAVAGNAIPGSAKAGSLAQMLVQALHSNDNSLLDECLGNTNEAVVHNTVARLPPAYVTRLLMRVVEKFQAKPSRGLALMAWIRAVLVIHIAYLMTLPDLPNMLSGLYR